MSELAVGPATGLPDLNAIPDPVQAAAPAAPPPPPPAPMGWPIEAAAGIAKFPFAFLAERRLAVPIVGALGGQPHWKLSDAEADLLAPAIKHYLDQVAPASTPAGQLLLGLAIVIGPRVVIDRLNAVAAARSPQPQAQPAPASPLPTWAEYAAANPPPPEPIAAPVTPGGNGEQPPTRAGFWAGAQPPRHS